MAELETRTQKYKEYRAAIYDQNLHAKDKTSQKSAKPEDFSEIYSYNNSTSKASKGKKLTKHQKNLILKISITVCVVVGVVIAFWLLGSRIFGG